MVLRANGDGEALWQPGPANPNMASNQLKAQSTLVEAPFFKFVLFVIDESARWHCIEDVLVGRQPQAVTATQTEPEPPPKASSERVLRPRSCISQLDARVMDEIGMIALRQPITPRRTRVLPTSQAATELAPSREGELIGAQMPGHAVSAAHVFPLLEDGAVL
ncbi:uncharacterized protein TrAtP1_008699 [Trichoderma atroviride]|uniref:uncharacterized protein n=1 Tax=Hypocrea atroviridis TaxID=63577 RepID=UPI0033192712|nr:hypothetical protein TrAtP1_008699 [Trichoderma atroviride]